MTEINLLPWREKKREYEKRQFTALFIGGFLFAVMVIFLFNFHIKSLIDKQDLRNIMLKAEIMHLDNKLGEIKKLKQLRAALISKIAVVQQLQGTRSLTVHLFNELINIMPSMIFLTAVQKTQDKVTLLGMAESNAAILTLMRNIENNNWIQKPELTEIKKTKAKLNAFKLNFILKPKMAAIYE